MFLFSQLYKCANTEHYIITLNIRTCFLCIGNCFRMTSRRYRGYGGHSTPAIQIQLKFCYLTWNHLFKQTQNVQKFLKIHSPFIEEGFCCSTAVHVVSRTRLCGSSSGMHSLWALQYLGPVDAPEDNVTDTTMGNLLCFYGVMTQIQPLQV